MPIPEGVYTAKIHATEKKPTKAGDGSYLSIEFRVLGGEFDGRRIWTRLNLQNPSPIAVRLARGELSAICRAVGVLAPRDSAELHGLRLVLRIAVKKGADGEAQNVIREYTAHPDGALDIPV